MEHATFALVKEDSDVLVPRDRTLYATDIHAWAIGQAELIRLGRFDELDRDNLADEVEDVARRERKDLESRLSVVFQHLLKWDHQRDRRTARWARTIKEQRRQVSRLLKESPSLRSRLDDLYAEAFGQGRIAALNETGLDEGEIPDACPYSWDEMMTRPVDWPEP